nr:leiomodin-1 [Globicephala melas]
MTALQSIALGLSVPGGAGAAVPAPDAAKAGKWPFSSLGGTVGASPSLVLGAQRALSVSSPGMAIVPTGTAHLQALCWELQSWEQRPGPQRVREATVLPSQQTALTAAVPDIRGHQVPGESGGQGPSPRPAGFRGEAGVSLQARPASGMGALQRAAGPYAVGTAGRLTSVWGMGHGPSSPAAPRGDGICDGTTLNPGGGGLPGQTEDKQVETKTDAKKGEERGRDASKKPLGPRRDSDLGKEPKRGGLKKSFSRDKDEAESKGSERPKEEKLIRGLEKGRVRAAVDKKEAGKEGRAQEGTAAPRKDEEKQGSASGDKGKKGEGKKVEEKKEASQREGTEKVKGQRKDTDARKEGQEVERGSRDRGARPEDEKARKEEPRRAEAPREEPKSPAPERSAPGDRTEPADGPAQAEEEAAPSVFDEPLERVKSNDPEVTELNVNNSDCITTEILVRFAEALEFNTAVKVFALANTRADDHVAFAIAIMLKANKTITSLNLDSNRITGKGILAIFRALLQNSSLTELRFHNQRHICGGKTEMEMAKLLKENTTLLKLGYHFELAGPRMTVTSLLSRNMDRQRQKRLQERRQEREARGAEALLEVPRAGAPTRGSPRSSPQSSPRAAPRTSPGKGGAPAAPPPPPPPLAPPLLMENLKNSLSPATQRKMGDKVLPAQEKNSRDQLLAAIRSSNLKQLKKVEVPKLLQ